ncbi:MAG: Flp family type IVb pilin [Alphaproteobacteria bacterium]|nr:Flp family type IVb pilin [Alphaproteobacteria bacterium]
MKHLAQTIRRLIEDDQGATAIEYALIASILGVALLPVLTNTSSGMASLYTRVDTYFTLIEQR